MGVALAGSWPTGRFERTHGRGAGGPRRGKIPRRIILPAKLFPWLGDLGFVTSGMSRFATDARISFRDRALASAQAAPEMPEPHHARIDSAVRDGVIEIGSREAAQAVEGFQVCW